MRFMRKPNIRRWLKAARVVLIIGYSLNLLVNLGARDVPNAIIAAIIIFALTGKMPTVFRAVRARFRKATARKVTATARG